MSSLDYLDLCRLCLVKDSVSVPIFEGEGDVRQIFLKIAACLPVKVAREDKLPKKICDDCVYKVELLYQFWNTTANAEKQLLQWLGEVGLEDKQGYVTGVLNPQSTMKQEASSPGGLGGVTMQVNAAAQQQPGIGIGAIDNMGLGMPMIISGANPQQLAVVPMDTSAVPVQPVHQVLPGPSNQANQISQAQPNAVTRLQDEEEETSEEEENSDDDCDGDDGLPVKEESEEDPGNSRTIEPTTFVNVSLACDEAGPSGLQQQKLPEIPEMTMPQTVDGDAKSGSNQLDPLGPSFLTVKLGEDYFLIPQSLSVFMMKEPNPPNEAGSKADVKSVEARVNSTDDNMDDTPLDFRRTWSNNKVKTKAARLKKFYNCDICHLSFEKKSKLTSHMFEHSNSKPYKCPVCTRGFTTTGWLTKHLETHDEPSQEHACTLCDFKARTKPYLKIHYIKKHTEDYKYSCDECGERFKVQTQYTTHLKDHDTESSSVCDICGNSYASKSSLYFHKRYKHKIKVKEFECLTCHKRFKSQKNLDCHSELHKVKYVCEQCGMEYKFKHGLTKHLKTHSGENKYLCSICGKTFGSLSSQKIHQLTHVGERPYVCDLCGKSFTQRSPMMLHRRKHPGVHPAPPPIKIGNLLHGV